MRPAAPPPRTLVAVSVAVLSVATVLAVLGATHTGVTTDEPIHVMRLRNFFDTGWYALDWDYGGQGPGGEGTNTFVYAPVTMLLLHGWSVLWGAEGWHHVATSTHAYHVRHLGVVAIGLVGVVAVAVMGRVVLRCWRWGLVAAAGLAAIPMWTGHEMFNVKDIPVATGHTLATLGLLLFVRADPARVPLRLARGGCLVIGLVLALGTRPGMWPGLLVLLVVAVLGILLAGMTRLGALAALAELALACGVAATALVATYPQLYGAPLRSLPRTSEASSSFLDGDKSDRLYVPRHLLQDMPTLLLVFAATGVVVAGAVLLRHHRRDRVHAARVALIGVQALTLPLVAIVMGSDLYHGLRQLLFAIPALALLAAYGMAWCLERPRTSVRRGLALVAAAALVLPTVDQVTLQPYQTTYVNLAADLVSGGGPADARPGGDFWRVSIPELIADARLDRQLLCKVTTDPDSDLAYPFTNGGEAFSTSRSLDCREEASGPLASVDLPLVRQLPVTEYDAVFLGPLPQNCTPVDDVTRWRHGFAVVLSTLGRCAVDPQPLTASGVRADEPTLGTTLPGDLWLYATDGWEQWPGRLELTSPVPVAELAFQPAAPCGAHRCTLVLMGSGPADLVATVAGQEVRVTHGPDGTLRIPLPAGEAGQSVWVTLTRGSDGPLGMTMTGLSLTAATTKGHA